MIRNLLYCYSSNAKRSFLANKNYAYIFNHFYNKAGEMVVILKSKDKPELFKAELKTEMDDINKLSLKTLADLDHNIIHF